jgi:hypothetical protein
MRITKTYLKKRLHEYEQMRRELDELQAEVAQPQQR